MLPLWLSARVSTLVVTVVAQQYHFRLRKTLWGLSGRVFPIGIYLGVSLVECLYQESTWCHSVRLSVAEGHPGDSVLGYLSQEATLMTQRKNFWESVNLILFIFYFGILFYHLRN